MTTIGNQQLCTQYTLLVAGCLFYFLHSLKKTASTVAWATKPAQQSIAAEK
jgi:hypothetical protein